MENKMNIFVLQYEYRKNVLECMVFRSATSRSEIKRYITMANKKKGHPDAWLLIKKRLRKDNSDVIISLLPPDIKKATKTDIPRLRNREFLFKRINDPSLELLLETCDDTNAVIDTLENYDFGGNI